MAGLWLDGEVLNMSNSVCKKVVAHFLSHSQMAKRMGKRMEEPGVLSKTWGYPW